MTLWGSLFGLLASVAGLVTLGSSYFLGDVSAVAFAISLFLLICATEARGEAVLLQVLQSDPVQLAGVGARPRQECRTECVLRAPMRRRLTEHRHI